MEAARFPPPERVDLLQMAPSGGKPADAHATGAARAFARARLRRLSSCGRKICISLHLMAEGVSALKGRKALVRQELRKNAAVLSTNTATDLIQFWVV
jgi:hypothetical protein